MTRAVLYANADMEPITVIDVPEWATEMLMDGQRVHFITPPDFDLTSFMAEPGSHLQRNRMVTIWGEMFRRHDRLHLMLFTDDDEIALLMRAAFLPGQQGAVNAAKIAARHKGLVDGFIKGIEAQRRRAGGAQ